MQNKFDRLIELRKQQETTQSEIDALVAELSGIIKPVKKRNKKENTKEAPVKEPVRTKVPDPTI
jgi:hypothetical protein